MPRRTRITLDPLGARVALWPLGTRISRVALWPLLPLGPCISFRSLGTSQCRQLLLCEIFIGERISFWSLGARVARLAFWTPGACLARFSSRTLCACVTFITFRSLWTHFAPQRTRRPILVFVFIKEPQDIVFLCPHQIRLSRRGLLRLRQLVGAGQHAAQVKAGSLVSLFPLQAGQPVRFRSLKPMLHCDGVGAEIVSLYLRLSVRRVVGAGVPSHILAEELVEHLHGVLVLVIFPIGKVHHGAEIYPVNFVVGRLCQQRDRCILRPCILHHVLNGQEEHFCLHQPLNLIDPGRFCLF